MVRPAQQPLPQPGGGVRCGPPPASAGAADAAASENPARITASAARIGRGRMLRSIVSLLRRPRDAVEPAGALCSGYSTRTFRPAMTRPTLGRSELDFFGRIPISWSKCP